VALHIWSTAKATGTPRPVSGIPLSHFHGRGWLNSGILPSRTRESNVHDRTGNKSGYRHPVLISLFRGTVYSVDLLGGLAGRRLLCRSRPAAASSLGWLLCLSLRSLSFRCFGNESAASVEGCSGPRIACFLRLRASRLGPRLLLHDAVCGHLTRASPCPSGCRSRNTLRRSAKPLESTLRATSDVSRRELGELLNLRICLRICLRAVSAPSPHHRTAQTALRAVMDVIALIASTTRRTDSDHVGKQSMSPTNSSRKTIPVRFSFPQKHTVGRCLTESSSITGYPFDYPFLTILDG